MTATSLRALLSTCALLLVSCASGSTLTCRCGERCERPARCGEDAATPDGGVPMDADVPVDAFVAIDAPPPDVPGCVDADGDGYPAASCGGTDCDDADGDRHPGAAETCDGADDDCDPRVDEGSFPAFFAGAGATTWRSFDLDCVSSAAPTAPIVTAFDVESLSRAYFLTATTYHVLDLRDRTWIGSGSRASILPETAGASLIASYTVPAGHAGGSPTIETLYLGSATQIWIYEIDLSSPSALAFTFTTLTDGRTNPVSWTAPAGLQTAYLDVTGTWAPDPRPTCPSATYSAGPYSAFFSADRVRIDDNGSCFVPIADLAISEFGPFAYATAPARSAWRHAVYNAGVWTFASPRLP